MRKTPKMDEKFPKYKTNPFIPGMQLSLGIKRKFKNEGTKDHFDEHTGVIWGTIHTTQVTEAHIEKEPFVKIFTATLRYIFQTLSWKGLKVFGYFMSEMHPNADTVEYNASDCTDFCGFTSRTHSHNGLYELLEKSFIARSESQRVYFVNIKYCINGKRIRAVNKALEDAGVVAIKDNVTQVKKIQVPNGK